MNASSVDIKYILENWSDLDSDSSNDVTLYPITISREPKTPKNCITIYDINAGPSDYLSLSKDKYEYAAVEIRVRSDNYLDGWSMAEHIKSILDGRANETFNNTYYSLIRCLNGPFLLDYDDNHSPRIVMSFLIQRR